MNVNTKVSECTDEQIILLTIKEANKALRFPKGHHCEYRVALQAVHDRLSDYIRIKQCVK